MSLTGRISELANKHRRLDHEISEEEKRPAADTLRLQDLKRQKLKIKEELRWLEAS
ncbi:MAG: YdcH family protein [Hyphomonas sp.]|uniref:YdcH family protein n=1 Tax=Hyphomonas sp. TaxID=87 RepID=UPI003529B334